MNVLNNFILQRVVHPCWCGDIELDHNFKLHSDVYGDDDVIHGTCCISWMECERCGETHDMSDGYGNYELDFDPAECNYDE